MRNMTPDLEERFHAAEDAFREVAAREVMSERQRGRFGIPYVEHSVEWRAGYDEAESAAYTRIRDLEVALRFIIAECNSGLEPGVSAEGCLHSISKKAHEVLNETRGKP